MDNFTNEPVIVNILELDAKFTVTKTIIFIGDVPLKIYNALHAYLSGKGSDNSLKKFYSKNWLARIEKLIRKDVKIKGGDGGDGGNDETDDFNFDTVQAEEKIGDVTTPDTEVPETPDIVTTLVDFIKEETIDITDLDRLTQAPVEEVEIDSDIILVRDLHVYPHDKVWDLKEKIYAVAGILPIYQHLWIEHLDIQHQCSYKIFNAGRRIPLSIYNLQQTDTNLQKIGNIPIDMQFYDDKFLIKVEAFDTFEILATLDRRYNSTEYNLVSIKSFINESSRNSFTAMLKNDRYQIDMIYYGFVLLYFPVFTYEVFINWIKEGEISLKAQYPELIPVRREVSEKYKIETNITQQADVLDLPENDKYLKSIEDNIKLSIVSSTIKVLKMGSSKETIIYLRNLFDEFALSETVDYAKCVLIINNRKTVFRKVFNKNPLISNEDSFRVLHPAYDRIPIGSIIFRIRLNVTTTECMYFILYQNGNYEIKSNWREDLGFGFDDIYKTTVAYVTPIIHSINHMESKVLYYNKNLPEMSRANSKFSEIGMAIFWNYNFSDTQFKILKSIMEEFRKGGIVETRLAERTEAEYYFIKGMHQYDAARLDKTVVANNYYEYLSNGIVKQKWATVFTNTRITKLMHRSADIKIEIIGIRENEYDVFNHYVYILLYMFLMENKRQHISFQPSAHRKKTLIDNKEQDPELYNTRKIYKTQFIYSRACQKPYQPRMLNDAEYEILTPEQKARAIKFWNFTRRTPVWYLSTNPKYPYIRFMVGKHPREYCIPCSKKTQVPDSAIDPNKIIHDICMEDHKWTGKKGTITVGSRYIMSYGKEIELDRLSRLPEKTLEPLFYDTYVSTGESIDQECADNTNYGYFLYGVPQNLPAAPNTGLFYCLCKAMNYSPEEFINQMKRRIAAEPLKFKVIMNGEIMQLFPSIRELTTTLDELGNCRNEMIRHLGEKWNVLFESIANIYFAINIIKFEDSELREDSEGQRCRLIIPNRLSNIDDFIPEGRQNLIVLYRSRGKIYYPIFQINKEVFFKTHIIDARLFDYNSDVVQIIYKMAKSLYTESRTHEHLDFNIIKRFLTENKRWKLEKLFINNGNYCYGILISGKQNKNIYIPIPRSFYNERTGIEYQPFMRTKYSCDFDTLKSFISDFNDWIAEVSSKMGLLKPNIPKSYPLEERVIPIYPFIDVDNWILLMDADIEPNKQKPQVIGFVFQSHNYYFNPPISPEEAMRYAKQKFYLLRYDPDDVNKVIFNKSPITKDPRVTNINLSIYRYYEYQLLLMEFMSLFSKQKNNKLRELINALILKTNFASQLPDFYTALRKLVEDNDDLRKIINFIDNIVNGEWSKKDLILNIKETTFNFDNVELDKLRKLPRAQLKIALTKIANSITTKTDDIAKYLKADNEFPNIFVVCKDQTNSGSCQSKKLIIERGRFDILIDILVQDLQNPLKSKWIFSNVFNDRAISMFKFIQRPFERIDISFD